jgi:hypothetical protein
MNTDSPIDLDAPIWGAEEIAHAIRRTTPQAYMLLEAGRIPARKIGKTWMTTRRRFLVNGAEE